MNRFTFTRMNDSIDRVLNHVLNKSMDSGIKTVTSNDCYYFTISFKNGSSIKVWNENKYYAWLSSGVFKYPDKSEYNWNNGRPKRSTMSRLYNMLSDI